MHFSHLVGRTLTFPSLRGKIWHCITLKFGLEKSSKPFYGLLFMVCTSDYLLRQQHLLFRKVPTDYPFPLHGLGRLAVIAQLWLFPSRVECI